MSVSKNQRSGPKRKQKEIICSKGHVKIKVKCCRVVGRAVMLLLCECDGFKPIEITKDYRPNHPKIKAAGGKARIWFEQPSSKS